MKLREKAARYHLEHPEDFPREKLGRMGASNLGDEELLAILLRTGFKGKSVFQVARSVLAKYSIEELMKLSYSQLVQIKGIGRSKAAILQACFELSKRALSKGVGVLPMINKPADAVALSADILGKKKENLLGFYLNGRSQVLLRETLSVGILDASIVHPREVFLPAIQQCASAVLLVHNHPSGQSEPSKADIEITQRIQEASRIMGIRLLDHIIVCPDGFTSMKESKIIS